MSAASVSRWRNLKKRAGHVRPGPLGGDRQGHKIEAHGATILSRLETKPDITLAELGEVLRQDGLAFSKSALHRFLVRHDQTRKKKTGHAVEQDRPDVRIRREDWFDNQLDLDPDRLVFIDETWTATNMTRSHGRCQKGQRLRMGFPHGHRKTTTFVAGLRRSGMVAPMVLDGPINGERLEAYVGQFLVPTLRPGDVVIMDNLGSHKRPSTRALIEAAGAKLLFLPPYSPDFNSIEKAFAKLKAVLRGKAERTVSALWDGLGAAIPPLHTRRMRSLLRSRRI